MANFIFKVGDTVKPISNDYSFSSPSLGAANGLTGIIKTRNANNNGTKHFYIVTWKTGHKNYLDSDWWMEEHNLVLVSEAEIKESRKTIIEQKIEKLWKNSNWVKSNPNLVY